MKVGIATFIKTGNYGALLQQYALQQVLQLQGVEAEILNYCCPEIEMNHNPSFIWKSSSVFKRLAAPILVPIYRSRRKKFECFERQYCKFSPIEYTLKTLPDVSAEYDCFIAGSDQVWNTSLTHSDPFFFLDFEHDGAKKCSYAASIGKEYWTDDASQCENALRSFRIVSLREETSAAIYRKRTGRTDACANLDPTLLLTKDHWEKFVKERPVKENYILLYMLPSDKKLLKKIRAFAKAQGCKLYILLKGFKPMWGIHILNTLSPEDFLTWIHHADYVIAGSYHGICFSVLLHKTFFATQSHSPELTARTENLLHQFGLSERLIHADKPLPNEKIDYDRVDVLMEQQRKCSINTLRQICQVGRCKSE